MPDNVDEVFLLPGKTPNDVEPPVRVPLTTLPLSTPMASAQVFRSRGQWSELGSRDTDGPTREGEQSGSMRVNAVNQ